MLLYSLVMKGAIVVASVACCVSAAQASFELGLFLKSNEIERVDMENNIYLGKFGAGKINGARKMVLDRGGRFVHVLHNGGKTIGTFDYSTGTLLSSVNLGASANYTGLDLSADGNNFLLAGQYATSSEFAMYSKAGGFVSATAVPNGEVPLELTQAANGKFVALTQLSPTSSTSNVYTAAALTSSYTLRANLANINDLLVQGNEFVGFGTFNAPASVRRVESDGGVTTILNWSFPFSVGGCFGGAASHTGYWVTRSSTTHTVSHWDRATLTFNSDITLPLAASNTYIGFATVVAPEPATVLALGLGALSLRKRRQK